MYGVDYSCFCLGHYSCTGRVHASRHVCRPVSWRPVSSMGASCGPAGLRGISPCLTLGFAAYWLPPSKAYGAFWTCWHLPPSLPLGSVFEECKDRLFTLPCLHKLTRSLSIFLSQCPLLAAHPVCGHCCSSRVLTVPAWCLHGSPSTLSLF